MHNFFCFSCAFVGEKGREGVSEGALFRVLCCRWLYFIHNLRISLQRKVRVHVFIRIMSLEDLLQCQFWKSIFFRLSVGNATSSLLAMGLLMQGSDVLWLLVHFLSTASEHITVEMEQTLKNMWLSDFEGQTYFSRFQGYNSWCSRHASGSHLPDDAPSRLAVAVPRTTQAWSFERSH